MRFVIIFNQHFIYLYLSKVFSMSGSQTILVFFLTKRNGNTPTGTP